MATVSSTLGSPTKTGWKRRSSAASFSMCLRYSSSVVAPTARSSPRASIGLSREDAADLVVAPDHRVELSLLCKFGQISAELLQRLVLVLRILVGHPVRPTNVLDGAQECLVVGSGGAQRLAGGCLGLHQREQKVLGGDVLILER